MADNGGSPPTHDTQSDPLPARHAELMALVREPALAGGDFEAAVRRITEAAARAMDTARVGVWLYTADHAALACADLFDRPTGRHASGAVLSAADYPDYFAALAQEQVIAVSDAPRDPRIAEFAPGYLAPLEIGAVLDVPVFAEGRPAGVVRHEHLGGPRPWTGEACACAAALADFVALALEGRRRHDGEARIRAAHDELERRLRERTDDLSRARRRAELAVQARNGFLSRMSHELRTPMVAILGYGQLLQEGVGEPLSPLQTDHVDHILEAGYHLLDLINEVLGLARLEADGPRAALEPVRVGEVFDECLRLAAPLARRFGVTLGDATRPACPRPVQGDPERLRQTLLNLLTHAIRHSGPGGRVSLSCGPAGAHRLTLAVADTGPPIPPARRKVLFDALVSPLPGEAGAESPGPVGLAIARALTESMGGVIGHDADAGGNRFFVTLPLAKAADPPDLLTVDAPGPVPAAAPRVVLCVEDEPASLDLVREILARRPDLTVLGEGRGEAGLTAARNARPDLILLDIHLPDLSGIQVLKRLRADPATAAIPVVAVSAGGLPGDAERALALGFARYVAKPYRVQHLLATVDQVLAAP